MALPDNVTNVLGKPSWPSRFMTTLAIASMPTVALAPGLPVDGARKTGERIVQRLRAGRIDRLRFGLLMISDGGRRLVAVGRSVLLQRLRLLLGGCRAVAAAAALFDFGRLRPRDTRSQRRPQAISAHVDLANNSNAH